jgi:hypothetical protein
MINQEVKPVSKPKMVDQENSNRFELFWKAYPRKTNKGFARTVWAKLKPDQATFDKMINAIAQQKKSEQWGNPQYIPHPSSWLNGERWEDEVGGTTQNNALAGAI